MAAWGLGPFDNDEATGWYLALIKTSDLSLIEEVLDANLVEDELFGLPDMDEIQAACEVVLGLLAPDNFERRSSAGPRHVDPLVDGLGPIPDLRERSSGANFSVPAELVDWVKQHRRLDAKPLLATADTILNHVEARGAAFYEGYFREEGSKDVWLSYLADLHGRIRKAMRV